MIAVDPVEVARAAGDQPDHLDGKPGDEEAGQVAQSIPAASQHDQQTRHDRGRHHVVAGAHPQGEHRARDRRPAPENKKQKQFVDFLIPDYRKITDALVALNGSVAKALIAVAPAIKAVGSLKSDLSGEITASTELITEAISEALRKSDEAFGKALNESRAGFAKSLEESVGSLRDDFSSAMTDHTEYFVEYAEKIQAQHRKEIEELLERRDWPRRAYSWLRGLNWRATTDGMPGSP